MDCPEPVIELPELTGQIAVRAFSAAQHVSAASAPPSFAGNSSATDYSPGLREIVGPLYSDIEVIMQLLRDNPAALGRVLLVTPEFLAAALNRQSDPCLQGERCVGNIYFSHLARGPDERHVFCAGASGSGTCAVCEIVFEVFANACGNPGVIFSGFDLLDDDAFEPERIIGTLVSVIRRDGGAYSVSESPAGQ